jgi:hypothetical protein
MPNLGYIRTEIDRMRVQVSRQRKAIFQLQRAGVSTASAELLLAMMHTNIDALCAERERLKREQPSRGSRRPELVMREPPKWYDANAKHNPPWIKARAEVRHLARREGWRYQHIRPSAWQSTSMRKRHWATGSSS